MKVSRTLASGLFCLLLIFVAGPVDAASITLTWDPSPSSGVAGYKIYWGTESRNYDHSMDVGNTTQAVVDGLPDEGTVYLSATAYDAEGRESSYSEEVVVVYEANGTSGNSSSNSDSSTQEGEESADVGPEDETTPAADSDTADYLEPAAWSVLAPDETGALIPLEWGRVDASDWATEILFQTPMEDPVAITFPMTHHESDSFQVSIRELNGNGFQMALTESAEADGIHGIESVAYLAVEAGHYRLEGGLNLEADILTRRHNDLLHYGDFLYTYVGFRESFNAPPVVFVQEVYSGGEPHSVRVLAADSNGFWIHIASPTGSEPPTSMQIAYVAVEPGVGSTEQVPFKAGFVQVPDLETPVAISLGDAGMDEATVCFAQTQTFDGWTSKSVRLEDNTADGFLRLSLSSNAPGTWDATAVPSVVGFLAMQWP